MIPRWRFHDEVVVEGVITTLAYDTNASTMAWVGVEVLYERLSRHTLLIGSRRVLLTGTRR